MHRSHDHNSFTVKAIEDSVRKTAQKRSPGVPVDHCVYSGMGTIPVNRQLQSPKEIVAKASSSALVPLEGFLDVCRRSRADDDRH
jgi:hypothetical protein